MFALRASGLGLSSSMRLDGRKDIIALKLAFYPLYSEIIKDVKRTHTYIPFSENIMNRKFQTIYLHKIASL